MTPDAFRLLGLGVPRRRVVAPDTSGRAGVLVRPRQHLSRPTRGTLFPGSPTRRTAGAQTSSHRHEHRQRAHPRDRNLLRCAPTSHAAGTAQTARPSSRRVCGSTARSSSRATAARRLVTDTWSATDRASTTRSTSLRAPPRRTAPVVSSLGRRLHRLPPGYTADAARDRTVRISRVRPPGCGWRCRQSRRARSRLPGPPRRCAPHEHRTLDAVRAHDHARDADAHLVRLLVGDGAGDLATLIGQAGRALGRRTACANLVARRYGLKRLAARRALQVGKVSSRSPASQRKDHVSSRAAPLDHPDPARAVALARQLAPITSK